MSDLSVKLHHFTEALTPSWQSHEARVTRHVCRTLLHSEGIIVDISRQKIDRNRSKQSKSCSCRKSWLLAFDTRAVQEDVSSAHHSGVPPPASMETVEECRIRESPKSAILIRQRSSTKILGLFKSWSGIPRGSVICPLHWSSQPPGVPNS